MDCKLGEMGFLKIWLCIVLKRRHSLRGSVCNAIVASGFGWQVPLNADWLGFTPNGAKRYPVSKVGLSCWYTDCSAWGRDSHQPYYCCVEDITNLGLSEGSAMDFTQFAETDRVPVLGGSPLFMESFPFNLLRIQHLVVGCSFNRPFPLLRLVGKSTAKRLEAGTGLNISLESLVSFSLNCHTWIEWWNALGNMKGVRSLIHQKVKVSSNGVSVFEMTSYTQLFWLSCSPVQKQIFPTSINPYHCS